MIIINQWWEKFENAGSRKLQTIRHFCSPSGNNSKGYRSLMKMGKDGIIAFGVFQALCQMIATMASDARKKGAAEGSNGEPFDLADLADLTRIDEKTLSKSIEILVGIGWLSIPDRINDLQSSASDLPSSPNDLPIHAQRRGEERRVEERREEEGLCPQADEKGILLDLWNLAPEMSRRRSSKAQVFEAWQKIKKADRPDRDSLMSAMEAWSRCEEWTKENAQFPHGLHLWIKRRQWENIPNDVSARIMTSSSKTTNEGPEGWQAKWLELYPSENSTPGKWSWVDDGAQDQIKKLLKL